MAKKESTAATDALIGLALTGGTAAAKKPAGKKKPEISQLGPLSDAISQVAAEKRGEEAEKEMSTVAAAAAAPSAPVVPDPVVTAAKKGGFTPGSNMALCKDLWSSRGKVFVTLQDFPVKVAIEKKVITQYLEMNKDEPATMKLVVRKDDKNNDANYLVPLSEE